MPKLFFFIFRQFKYASDNTNILLLFIHFCERENLKIQISFMQGSCRLSIVFGLSDEFNHLYMNFTDLEILFFIVFHIWRDDACKSTREKWKICCQWMMYFIWEGFVLVLQSDHFMRIFSDSLILIVHIFSIALSWALKKDGLPTFVSYKHFKCSLRRFFCSFRIRLLFLEFISFQICSIGRWKIPFIFIILNYFTSKSSFRKLSRIYTWKNSNVIIIH